MLNARALPQTVSDDYGRCPVRGVQDAADCVV
jgi:hypothetical protein